MTKGKFLILSTENRIFELIFINIAIDQHLQEHHRTVAGGAGDMVFIENAINVDGIDHMINDSNGKGLGNQFIKSWREVLELLLIVRFKVK